MVGNALKTLRNYLLGVLLLLGYFEAEACTTILCGKATTVDASVLMGHNEDMGIMDEGKLWYVPQNTGSRELNIPYIPYNPKRTYGYWASGNANTKHYGNILVGVNEHGLSMSCNWMHSKEAVAKNKGINRYALRQLVLEQAKTAKEAVVLIGQYIERYGQADWSGLTYCLSDNNESWVVETTTSQWVAKRVLDDEVYVVANRYTIGERFDMHSKDLYRFATAQGWYKAGETFDFAKVYGDAKIQNQSYDADREERVMELLELKKGFIGVGDIFEVLRDRYFGTEKYRLPVLEECKRECRLKKGIPRPIATNFTQSSFVAHLGEKQGLNHKNRMWYAFAGPSFSGYFPVLIDSDVYANKTEERTWFRFKELQIMGERNYENNQAFALLFWNNFEQKMFRRLDEFESSLGDKSQESLNRFTQSCFEDLLRHKAILEKRISASGLE